MKHLQERVLERGGVGFVGSHQCDCLVVDDHDVTCLDTLFTRDGSQTCSFRAVNDMGAYLDQDSAPTGPVNLDISSENTIGKPVGMEIDISGSASEVLQVPLPRSDPTRRKPTVPLANALADSVAYCQQMLGEIPASRISVFQP